VRTVDNDDMTDRSCSEDESYDESDGEMEDDEPGDRPLNVGRPRELGSFQGHGPAQGRPEMASAPKAPGQAGSVDVLTEIRKMIKEECMSAFPWCVIETLTPPQ